MTTALARRTAPHGTVARSDGTTEVGAQLRLASLGLVTGSIAHDLNNLLTIIQTNVDLLPLLSEHPEVAECVAEIREAVERGASLTREMSECCGQSSSGAPTADMNRILHSSVIGLRRQLGARIDIAPSLTTLDATVTASRTLVAHLLLVAVLEATEASPPARITVGTRTVRANTTIDLGNGTVLAGEYVVLAIVMTPIPAALGEAQTRRAETQAVREDELRELVAAARGHVAITGTVGRPRTIDVYLPRSSAGPVDEILGMKLEARSQ